MSDDEETAALLERMGPTRPDLSDIAKAKHPFWVPWGHKTITILTGLQSDRMADASGPWMLESPFDFDEMRVVAVINDKGSGATSYSEAYSDKSASSTQHLSVNLSITIGYPFLNASVTGEYDKTVIKNEDGVQCSRTSCCRVGRVMVQKTPMFSERALRILRLKGAAEFAKTFGDFYVCGYEIGADAAVCMSGMTKSKEEKERLKITVKVKVLLVEKSISHEESSYDYDAESSFTLCGFNTLRASSTNISVSSRSTSTLQDMNAATAEYLNQVSGLDAEVRAAMSSLGLEDGQDLPLENCSKLCESGLVVQLLLAPFRRLNQYVDAVKWS